MSKELKGDIFRDYGATSDPEVSFAAREDREIRITCDNVSTNIYTINSCIKNLKGVLGILGTSRDNQGTRDQIHVWQISGNQVIKATTSDIAKLTNLSRTASVQQKLQIKKITNHFKDAVQDYGAIQREVATKLRWHILQPSNETTEDDMKNLIDVEDEEARVQQQKQIQQQQLEFENEMLEERERRVREIETDILDINQLMNELGALVHEQHTAVDSIESNIEQSRGNVEEGRQQLIAASGYQQRLRRKKLYLVAILLVILAVLIGIIVWSSH